MKKKKLYYPFYDEKISKHLIKNNFNNDCNGFWFIGGDLLKRKYVFKHQEIDDSFKILYPQLLKKSRLSKKLKFFFTCKKNKQSQTSRVLHVSCICVTHLFICLN